MSLSDLRCGVIGGAGMMGCKHIANLAAHLLGARVTALADPHPPSREAALGLAPDAARFSFRARADHPHVSSNGVDASGHGTWAPWASPRILECWFRRLGLSRGRWGMLTFISVAELTDAVDQWTQHWNHGPKPLRGTEQAQPVTDKAKRAQAALNHATKPATHR